MPPIVRLSEKRKAGFLQVLVIDIRPEGKGELFAEAAFFALHFSDFRPVASRTLIALVHNLTQ